MSPQAGLPACQRISPRTAAYAKRAAGWLLNVTASGAAMAGRQRDLVYTIRSTEGLVVGVFCLVGRQGVEP